jgi:hypothetical protein
MKALARNQRWISFSVILIVLAHLAPAVQAQAGGSSLGTSRQPSPSSLEKPDLLVADCGGQYIAADRASGQVSRPQLLPFRGSPEVPLGKAGRDGCFIENLLSFGAASTILALVSPDRFMDGSGARRYSVVAFDSGRLAERARFEIPAPQAWWKPRLFSSDSGKYVYVLFQSGNPGSPVFVARKLDVATLSSHAVLELRSPMVESLIGTQGVTVDDVGVFRIDGQRLDVRADTAERISGPTLPWKAVSEARMRSGRADAAIQPAFRMDASAGRVLYISGGDQRGEGYLNASLVILDAETQALLGDFRTTLWLRGQGSTGSTSNAHLSPLGNAVIVEMYGGNFDLNSPQGSRFKTGELVSLDSASGAVLGRVQLTQGPSLFGRVVRFSSDGRTLLCSTTDKLFVIDVTSMTITLAIPLPDGFAVVAAVFLGEQPK